MELSLIASNPSDSPRKIPEAARFVVCHDENFAIDSHIWFGQLWQCSQLMQLHSRKAIGLRYIRVVGEVTKVAIRPKLEFGLTAVISLEDTR